MSKPRVQLSAVVDTQAHADTIISSVRTQLVGKDVFEEHNLVRSIGDNGELRVDFDFRLNNEIDRDSIKNWIRNQIQTHPQVKKWVQSAKLSWHECSHSDPVVKDCRTTDYFEWSKP